MTSLNITFITDLDATTRTTNNLLPNNYRLMTFLFQRQRGGNFCMNIPPTSIMSTSFLSPISLSTNMSKVLHHQHFHPLLLVHLVHLLLLLHLLSTHLQVQWSFLLSLDYRSMTFLFLRGWLWLFRVANMDPITSTKLVNGENLLNDNVVPSSTKLKMVKVDISTLFHEKSGARLEWP